MTRRSPRVALLAALALLAAAGRAGASTTGDPTCFGDWSTAVPVVKREALAAVRDIHAGMRQRNLGDVVRVTLCTEDSRYVYRLIVREPRGRIVPMTVDARQPFAP
jgi:hypothetical protein